MGTCAIEDTDYLASKIKKYDDLCQLLLFCDIIKLQYVGTETYDTHRMLHDIYLALSNLNLVSKVNGKLFPLHPILYINVLLNSHPFFPPTSYLDRSAS